MKEVKTISRYEFLKLIRGIDGKQATFISLFVITKQKLNTRGLTNPYGNFVYKYSKIVGLINFNYENMVHKKDESYEVKERSWGTKTNDKFNGTLVDHNENDYLTIAIQQVLYKPKFKTSEGKFISENKFKSFLPVKKTSYVENELKIFFRNYRLESIHRATIGKVCYRIKD